jgi:small subunit ribosomal protein S21
VAKVILRPNESAESLIKRFRRKVGESGILQDVRRKRWYMSPSEVRRLQKKKAMRRARRRQRQHDRWLDR